MDPQPPAKTQERPASFTLPMGQMPFPFAVPGQDAAAPMPLVREMTVEASAIAMSDDCYKQHLRLVEQQQAQDALAAERQFKLEEKRLDYAHAEKMKALGIQTLYTWLSFFGLLAVAVLIGFLAYLQTSEKWISVAAPLVGAFVGFIVSRKVASKAKPQE